jgi:hypothetical protein
MYAVGSPNGSTEATFYSVNLASGEMTPIGATGAFMSALEFRADGQLYGGGKEQANNGISSLYRLDRQTGLAIEVGELGVGIGNAGLSFVPGTLFADGVERGDTSRWSESVEE